MNAIPNAPISVVMPAYNEAAVIARAVCEAEESLHGRFDAFEIIVVDDGSVDETAAIVEEMLPISSHTRLIRHGVNRGYGAALRTGFEAARHGLVAFTDADCQFDLAELAVLARLTRDYPIAAGYRADRQDPGRRRFFSWGYNCLARALVGTRVRDVDCALKVFRREALAQLLPESRGFFVNTEMLTRARQLGFAVIEAPVTHRPRAGGDSKVSLREVPRVAARLLSFWWSAVVLGGWPAAAKSGRTPGVTPAVFQARAPVGASGRVPDLPPYPSPAPRAGRRARPRGAA